MTTPKQVGQYSVYAGRYSHVAYVICDERDRQWCIKHGARLLRQLTRFRIPPGMRREAVTDRRGTLLTRLLRRLTLFHIPSMVQRGAVTDRLGTFLIDISGAAEGEELTDATRFGLQDSKFLIVVMSEFANRSERIRAVAQYFDSLPQFPNLRPIAVGGLRYVPVELQYQPSELRNGDDNQGKVVERLVPVIAKGNDSWDQAALRLIAEMIDRPYNDLAPRVEVEKRRNRRRLSIASAVLGALLIFMTYLLSGLRHDVGDAEYLHAMVALDEAWNRGDRETALALLEKNRPVQDRSFEWYHWDRRLNRAVGSGLFDPGTEGDAGRWSWRAHQRAIEHIALSWDGRSVITSAQNEVAIWNASTGGAIKKYAEARPVTALALSQHSSFWAIGDVDGQVLIRNMPDGQATLLRAGDDTPIQKLVFSPRGDQLLLLPRGKHPLVLNYSTEPPMDRFSKADAGVELTSRSNGTTVESDVPPGSPLDGLLLPAGSLRGVQDATYFAGGNRILTVTQTGFLELWDARARQRIDGLSWGTVGVRTVAVSADGSQILSTGADIGNPSSFLTRGVDVLVIREIREGTVVRTISAKLSPNLRTGLLPSMKLFGSETPLFLDARFVGSITRVIRLDRGQAAIDMLETGTMTRVLALRASKGHPQCVDVAEDGTLIAAGTDEGIAVIWSSARAE